MSIREIVVGAILTVTGALSKPGEPIQVSQEFKNKSLYDFTMKDIDGKDVKLSKFKGKTVLVVNVASQCGLTPQYEGLQKLYTEYKDRGLIIIGLPANQFGNQEPGVDAEIKTFCESKYHVTFPMFSKIVVKGEGIHPLYQWLLANTDPTLEVEWNFAKFLVGRDGKVAGRFSPKTSPSDPKLIEAIKREMADE